MFEVITPCPKCGSNDVGHQFMRAIDTAGHCLAPRKCCRCGWRGEPLWPAGECLEWRPFQEPVYPANWRAIADALVYGFKVGDSEAEEDALRAYWEAGGSVLMDLSDNTESTPQKEAT